MNANPQANWMRFPRNTFVNFFPTSGANPAAFARREYGAAVQRREASIALRPLAAVRTPQCWESGNNVSGSWIHPQ
jgi:hypothetical protein